MTAVLGTETQDRILPEVAQGMTTAPGVPEEASCGPSRRTGLLDEVWTASARVEGLQWEMDDAQDCLAAAMRKATSAGAGLPDLAIASGLSFARIEQLLGQQPLHEEVAE